MVRIFIVNILAITIFCSLPKNGSKNSPSYAKDFCFLCNNNLSFSSNQYFEKNSSLVSAATDNNTHKNGEINKDSVSASYTFSFFSFLSVQKDQHNNKFLLFKTGVSPPMV